MQVGVRVAAIDEPFAPVAGRELSLRHREASRSSTPVRRRRSKGAGLEMHHRLDHPNLAERPAAGYRVRAFEGRHRLGPQVPPGPALGRQLGWRQRDHTEGRQPERGERLQPASATAARTGVTAARRKSRFIRVMVSMLMSLGHASWHSP